MGPPEGQEERQLLVVPDSMVHAVLAKLHNNGGYFGVEKRLIELLNGFGSQAKHVQLRAMYQLL